ncbi:hypothetical protein NDU88_002091 [Pleurodeles waltl]|uniref:Uncharacterized protein n=1 Tax=Pleurodeles waltl TaxID=8319 RepID=A0AAV7R902_PLEWA|nr:hypothetical protein NDU88_002091 [Pleurodeles waltl]
MLTARRGQGVTRNVLWFRHAQGLDHQGGTGDEGEMEAPIMLPPTNEERVVSLERRNEECLSSNQELAQAPGTPRPKGKRAKEQ